MVILMAAELKIHVACDELATHETALISIRELFCIQIRFTKGDVMLYT